ncbi:PQQ-binding-like beta-propeller repeat protein, partial [Actinoplanes philippinensis]|uniref:outer membrane protein assembly factor BamB family protein n=1 Tax=Actinoplanes philippinensis TaxID=35752 RepID=UPI003F4D072C
SRPVSPKISRWPTTVSRGWARSSQAGAWSSVVAPPLWDHPGYDAEDSHHNPAETVITGGRIRQVTQKWQAGLRASDESCSGFGEPILSAGRVYVSDQLGISAYTADTGAVIWRYDWADPGDAETPRLAVSDGLLIAAGGGCNSQSDPDGEITALDARTGLPRWKLRVDIPVNAAVVDKSLVIVSGGSPSDEDAIVAYHVRDGREAWRKARHLAAGVSANGTILARLTDGSDVETGTSVGIAVATGTVRWTRTAEWTAQAATPGSDRFLVTDKTGNLHAVRVSDGALDWTAATGDSTLLAVDRERVYRVHGRDVEALRVTDGRRAWTARQKADGVQPVTAGGLLYAGAAVLSSADGTVAGPEFAGRVIVTGGRIHQVVNGRLRTLA